MLSHPAFGPRVALIYVTTGALTCVWTAVYYFAYGRGKMSDGNPADDNTTWFWVVGFFLTGIVLIVLGLFLGQLGREARKAELPPEEVTKDEKDINQTAAATPHPVVPTPGMVPGMAPQVPQPVAPTVPAGTVPQPMPPGRFAPQGM
jgi:hypothetical protein